MKEINNIPVYATVEEADEYLSMKWGASSWATVPEAEKQILLVTATREIDNHDFQGLPAKKDQELKFPRVICCDECKINPEKELRTCASEIAYALSNTVTNIIATPNAENIKSMSVGDTSITYKDGATIETDSFSAVANPIIKKHLGKFLRGNIRVLL